MQGMTLDVLEMTVDKGEFESRQSKGMVSVFRCYEDCKNPFSPWAIITMVVSITALWMVHLREYKQGEKGIFCPETALNVLHKNVLSR